MDTFIYQSADEKDIFRLYCHVNIRILRSQIRQHDESLTGLFDNTA